MLAEYSEWRTKQAEIDAAEMADLYLGIRRMREHGRRGNDQASIEIAMRSLAGTALPAAYLEGIRMELLQMLGLENVDRTYCYLTFWGVDGRAEFLKIGVARNVKNRMNGIRTGNPLDRLWTYTMALNSRGEAMKVEAALLENMKSDRTNGEWVRVAGCSEQACKAIADDLAELAATTCGRPTPLTLE